MQTQGAIHVDFAGSLNEAQAFAVLHGLKAPKNWLYRDSMESNGCACLSIPYRSVQSRLQAIETFERLGWKGCWGDTKGRSRKQKT